MRCLSCQCILTDKEATRKSVVTGEYLDLCNRCLASIAENIPDSIDEEDDLWDDDESFPQDGNDD